MVQDAQSELGQDEQEHDDADDLMGRIEFLGLSHQPVSKVTNTLSVHISQEETYPIVKRAGLDSQTQAYNDADHGHALIKAMPPDPSAQAQDQDTEGHQADKTPNHEHGMDHSHIVVHPFDRITHQRGPLVVVRSGRVQHRGAGGPSGLSHVHSEGTVLVVKLHRGLVAVASRIPTWARGEDELLRGAIHVEGAPAPGAAVVADGAVHICRLVHEARGVDYCLDVQTAVELRLCVIGCKPGREGYVLPGC